MKFEQLERPVIKILLVFAVKHISLTIQVFFFLKDSSFQKFCISHKMEPFLSAF